MNILAFDTSGPHVTAALLSGGTIIAQKHEDMARGQAERLLPLLEEVLGAANMKWSDLDRIGVGIGPGNFTGIRISVSAARGLALGLSIPAVGVSLFQTTARLSNWTQVAVAAARDKAYYWDPEKMHAPALMDVLAQSVKAWSSEHSAQAHVIAIAELAAAARAPFAPPAPLYIKAADAAPSSDPPPVILDDA